MCLRSEHSEHAFRADRNLTLDQHQTDTAARTAPNTKNALPYTERVDIFGPSFLIVWRMRDRDGFRVVLPSEAPHLPLRAARLLLELLLTAAAQRDTSDPNGRVLPDKVGERVEQR